ncbi:MAG: ATP synthase F1 subunit delta [bacterium]
MSINRVAGRYAKALFEHVLEINHLDEINSDMERVRDVYKASPELGIALANPVLPIKTKCSIVKEIFFEHSGSVTTNFINFLSHRNRLGILKNIAFIFKELVQEHKGIVEAQMVTVMPAESAQKEKLAKALETRFKKTFIITSAEDKDLMAGFKLMIQDRVYDCSLKYQLKVLKEKLIA